MARLELSILGPFQVTLDGQPVTTFESHKVRALLAYLAAEAGRPQPRERLADLLWPDWPQQSAMSNLRYALADLRKNIADREAVPPFLLITRDSIQLNLAADVWVDVREFEEVISEQGAATGDQRSGASDPGAAIRNPQSSINNLKSAISLYRGAFLEGFSLSDSPPFEEWLLAKREYFSRQVLKVLYSLADGYEQSGECEQAIRYAQRQLELESWREEAHQQLMRLLALSGQRSAALAQYEKCRKSLREGLGVEPGAETTAIYERIRAGTLRPAGSAGAAARLEPPPATVSPQEPPAPAARPRPSLPHQVSRFIDRTKEIDTAGTPLDRMVSGRLVGRERELAEALKVWRKAQQGESGILLISGEPGVGKTRLAHELIVQAQLEDSAVLVGECYAEGSAPYAAFAQMILEAADWAADLPQLVLADLISLAPALRVRYPDVPLNPSLEPAAEQQRLYESAFTLFARLAGSAPLLLLLEDMHWADGGTLALARSLARRFHQTRTPALMILTFREGELSEKKGLGDLLNSWNRERLASPLKLHRLDRQGTQDMLEVLFAESVSTDFADGVYRETEGNPFFIEEICKALIDSGQVYREGGRWQRRSTASIELPRSIRMAIETRLAGLPESCQEVLHLAGVLGRRFEFDVLLAAVDPASQWDEEILITALEAAERAQLLVEIGRKGAGIFEFAHALIPTTLTEGISGMRCRRLHQRAIAALEKLHPEDYKALAHHCLEASEEPRALDYLIQAAQQARTAFANAEAVANYQQALGLLSELYHGQAQDDHWRLVALPLYESLGDVLELTGQHEQAWNAYQNALVLAPASEGIRRSGLFRKAGKTRELLRLYDDADQVYRQAEAALGPELDRDNPDWRQEWVALQLERIYLYYWPGRVQEMMELVEKVRPAVERYGAPLQLGKLYYNIGLALVRRDRYVISDEILAYMHKSVEILRETGVRSEQNFAEFVLGFDLLWHWDLKEAEKQFLIALQASERTGDVTIETRCLTYLAVTYRKLGDVPNVKTYAARSLDSAAIGQMIEYIGMGKANLAWAALREGNLVEAQQLCETAWETFQQTGTQMFCWVAVWPLIGICLAQNRAAEAIDFARILLAPTDQPQPETIAGPLQAAIQAWEQGQPEQAIASLTQAAALAEPLGYL